MDIRKIKFIQESDQIEEITDGYSGAIIYKIIRKKENYFLKIFNYPFHSSSLEKIKNGLEIYKKLDIKSLEIIDSGRIEGKDYIVYNYIDGINLREYSNNLSCDEIKKIGTTIGREFFKVKNYKKEIEIFPIIDLKQVSSEAITNFDRLLNQQDSRAILLKYFSSTSVAILKEKLLEYQRITEKSEKGIIHGDIKRANIIMKGNHWYIVDCESIQIAPDIMNFRHQITWALFSKEEKSFISGYLDGLYNRKRPLHFNQMALYCIILNFFQATYGKYKQGGILKMEEYLIKSKAMFENIKMLDLSLEFII